MKGEKLRIIVWMMLKVGSGCAYALVDDGVGFYYVDV